MCIRPVQISHQAKRLTERLNALNVRGRFESSPLDYFLVPCGKCPECIKTRQNHHAYKLYQRIKDYSTCYHITFTYRPEALPFSLTYNYVDYDTGETWPMCSPESLTGEQELSSIREWYIQQHKSSKPVYFYSQLFKYDEFSAIQAVITPSLQRSDIRNMLKVCRITYERKYGVSMPDFVYSFCGEYGPKKCRPHYHMVIASKFDISEAVQYLCSYWNNKYGFTVCRKVNRTNDNETDGYELVSKYISKYVSKGDFECESVLSGYAEKGRVCQSKGLDPRLKSDIFENNLIPYFRAYDLFGEYDICTLRIKSSGEKLSTYQLDLLCDEIINRSSVKLGQVRMSMPRYLKEAIFYLKNYNGKLHSPIYELSDDLKRLRKNSPELFSSKLIRSTISYLVEYRLQEQDFERKAQELQRAKQLGIAAYISACETRSAHRAQRINKAYKDFLSKSLSKQ